MAGEITTICSAAFSIEGRITLNGQTYRLPVTQVTINYPMGGVPSAAIVLAVGMDPMGVTGQDSGSSAPAFGPDVAVQIKADADIAVFAKAKGDISPTRTWPTEEFVLWAGQVVGTGYALVGSSCSYVISSSHWVAKLGRGTVASADVVPGQYTNMLTKPGFNKTLGAGAQGSLYGIIRGKLNGGNVWEGIKAAIKALTASDGISNSILSERLRDKPIFDTWTKGNKTARSLLGIDPGGVSDLGGTHVFDDPDQLIPGDLSLSGRIQAIYDRLAQALELTTRDALSGYSVLGLVTTSAQMVMAQMVVTTQSATVVPYAPVLAEDAGYWRELTSADFVLTDGHTATPRAIAAVGMVGIGAGKTTDSADSANGALATVGVYAAPTKEGQLLMIPQPVWMRGGVLLYTDSTHVDKGKLNDGSPNVPANDLLTNAASAYAQGYFFDAAFGNRTATIRCPFRLDIAPASRLKLSGLMIGTGGGVQVSTGDSALYAVVDGVRVLVDSDSASAYTELSVSHLMSPAELSAYSAPDGPLIYEDPWLGSPLVKLSEEDLTAEAETE